MPKITLLFCDFDLGATNDCTMRSPVSLSSCSNFNPVTDNRDLPFFLSTVLNGLIGATQAHDYSLLEWQRKNKCLKLGKVNV